MTNKIYTALNIFLSIVFDDKLDQNALGVIRNKLNPFNSKTLFFKFEYMFVGVWIIDKLRSLIQLQNIITNTYFHIETVHEFNGMVPNSTHFSFYMPA